MGKLGDQGKRSSNIFVGSSVENLKCFQVWGFVLNTKTIVVYRHIPWSFKKSDKTCCQVMNRLVIPRWDAWMSNRGKAASMFESWLAVQLRETPPCDMVTQLLQFLEMVFQGGMFCYGEDHRDLFQNVPAFFEKMLRHEGQLGYTPHTLSSRFDIYIYMCVCVCVTFLCGFVRCRENYIITSPPYFMKNISTCVFCFTVRCVFPRIQWGTKWKIRNFGSLTRAPAGGRKKKYVVIVWRKPLTSCTMWTLQTSCSSGLNPVFLLCNGNNSNIYICKTCAIYVYKEFQLDWNTWTPTYICILRSHIQYMNKCMMLSCDRSVCHNIHKYHCRCRK